MSDPTGERPVTTPDARAQGGTSGGQSEQDWTAQVTDLVVDTVDKVRDRTTGPILEISHGSVHALVAVIVLLPVAVLGLLGLIRLLNWAIPGDVWFVYAGLGTVFCLLGVALWSRRTPST